MVSYYMEDIDMKQWFRTTFHRGDRTVFIGDQIVAFANANNLGPGEVVPIIQSKGTGNQGEDQVLTSVSVMYYAEKEIRP
jgi:hypothetical protein